MNILSQEIIDAVHELKAENTDIGIKYLQRASGGLLTRDENQASHFCVYFLPYDKQKGRVFMVHHKKSGLWLSPGGHLDKDEQILQALNREIKEELGVANFFPIRPKPFLLSVTPIENPKRQCKVHFDMWFLMETDGSDFNVDPEEFLATKWLLISEANKLKTDKANLEALDLIAHSNHLGKTSTNSFEA